MNNQALSASISEHGFISSDLDQKIFSQTVHLSHFIKSKYSIDLAAHSEKSLQQLYLLDEEKKDNILSRLQNWSDILVSGQIIEKKDRSLDEKIYAEVALKKFNLKASKDFWAAVASNHVLEIYALDMCQIYRSFNFFKFSGYSILDISVFEWFTLWERPKLIISSLFEEVNDVINNQLNVKISHVPPHLLREVMNTYNTLAFEPRACHMQGSVIFFVSAGLMYKIF